MNNRQEDLLMEKLDIIITLLEEIKNQNQTLTIDEYMRGYDHPSEDADPGGHG